ncbi:hypothetical protein HHK36_017960 [Tetracentron sinense]|uniref:Uncharacterized protein n=1 Tax=Tetracentron sinense TaxID=13715 RepID=A0A835DAE1_TETSI|nr:hypothetical protein HHK36_017960 [Tetracentron sinense]
MNMSLKECKVECLKNCSCTTYANSDIRAGGSGCSLWFGDLNDIREFPEGDTIQDVYIQMAASEPADTITLTQSIGEGQTLVSTGQSFELGFFTPGKSKNRYIGIWYKNSPTAVLWVANRKNPITDSSGVLTIRKDGNLVLLNQAKIIIWSSNLSKVAGNSVAQLLDSGNLVLRDGSGSFLWQSFDFPSDTQFAGMKIGWELKTGLNRYLSSWRSADDPSPGDFTYRNDIHGLPQLVLRDGTSKKQFRSGPWNGLRFSGVPLLSRRHFKAFFVYTTEESYYMYENNEKSFITRLTLNESGLLQRLILNEGSSEWSVLYTVQKENVTVMAVVVLTVFAELMIRRCAIVWWGLFQNLHKNGMY